MKLGRTLITSLLLTAGLAIAQAPVSADPVPLGDKAPAQKLRKRKPVTCTGTDDIVLRKVRIDAAANAVTIMGSCDITIKDSVIKGGKHALLIRGSGDITVVNSTIESGGSAVTIQGSGDVELRGARVTGKAAITIQGSGDVEARDTQFRGRKVVQGTGEYKDKGGNSWKK